MTEIQIPCKGFISENKGPTRMFYSLDNSSINKRISTDISLSAQVSCAEKIDSQLITRNNVSKKYLEPSTP